MSTIMQCPAFSAKLPMRSTPRQSMKAVSARVQQTEEQLRELYKITAAPDIEQAASAALTSSRNLERFLSSRPIAAHTRLAFESFLEWRARRGARELLAIDSGCGCGQSVGKMARVSPHVDFLGVDRSFARLSRNAAFRVTGCGDVDNALLLRAELVDFWRLLHQEKCAPDYHFLLYPNPYPKHADMKRRWHGHPAFPIIVALGGRLEIRASWEGYLHEFRAAYGAIKQWAPYQPLIGEVEELHLRPDVDSPLTNFEAKYARVGQRIHRLVIDARDSASRDPGWDVDWSG